MSKKEEDIGIIPSNEWKPELEKDVAFYLAKAKSEENLYFTKRYTPNKYPEKFKDKREEFEFQVEEIRRLRDGYDGLCGKGYGWLHYAKLRDPERGKISPTFRAKQEQYFRKVETLQKKKGTGIIGFKRRRFGFSSMLSWDCEHDCMLTPFFQIGMNSKTETDSRNLFKHVKFIHQNLPEWLRPRATASDRRDFMSYAWHEKDANGNKITKGLQSWINVTSPVPSAHEGQAYSKLYIDEAGKIEELLSIWAVAEDCLRLNTRRVGLPILMGTVGDIDRDGKGLMELYKNADAYDLERFPVMGYNGLICDEFGNDMLEEAIRWIVYTRDKLKSTSLKNQQAFIQKYPLLERDAFNQVTGGGVGNIQNINDQIIHLMTEPPQKVTGWMRRKPDGGVDFVPDDMNGKVIIYERPQPRVNGYVFMTDPVEDDDVKKTRDTSEIATVIIAKPFNVQPAKLVAEIAYRPDKLDEYYEQIAMLLQWYDSKIQIEMNKGGWRMKKYFEEHYPNRLALAPVSGTSAKGGVEWRIGVKMTADRKEQMKGLIDDYTDNYIKFIPSIKLLEQFKVFGDDHADDDLAIAFGWGLILVQSDKTVVKSRELTVANQPTVSYQRSANGGFERTIGGKPVVTPKKSPLFR
jgi:hypothetical protein